MMADGAKEEVLTPGIHFISPLAKVKTYPVSQQQLVLSNNPGDYGKEEHADWHVDAPADGGMVKLNMTINYNFMTDRVVELYTKFNGMDGDAIVDSMVQNSIIAYIKEVTPQFSVMDIYSDKRAEVSKAITDYLNQKLNEEYGINISSALIIDVQLDDTLFPSKHLNLKIQDNLQFFFSRSAKYQISHSLSSAFPINLPFSMLYILAYSSDRNKKGPLHSSILQAKISLDLVHSLTLFYLERTTLIAMSAACTIRCFLFQILVMALCQIISG